MRRLRSSARNKHEKGTERKNGKVREFPGNSKSLERASGGFSGPKVTRRQDRKLVNGTMMILMTSQAQLANCQP